MRHKYHFLFRVANGHLSLCIRVLLQSLLHKNRSNSIRISVQLNGMCRQSSCSRLYLKFQRHHCYLEFYNQQKFSFLYLARRAQQHLSIRVNIKLFNLLERFGKRSTQLGLQQAYLPATTFNFKLAKVRINQFVCRIQVA